MFERFEVEGLVEHVVKSGIFAAVGLLSRLRLVFTGCRGVEAKCFPDARYGVRKFVYSAHLSSRRRSHETSLLQGLLTETRRGELVKICVIFFCGIKIIPQPICDVDSGRGSEICVVGLFAAHWKFKAAIRGID